MEAPALVPETGRIDATFANSAIWSSEVDSELSITATPFPAFVFQLPGTPFAQRGSSENLDAQIDEKRRYIRDMNAFVYCLHLAGMKHGRSRFGAFAIDQRHVFHINSGALAGEPAGRSRPSTSLLWGSTDVITKQTLDEGARLLAHLRQVEKGFIELAALLNRVMSAFREYDYPLCVVTAWSISEVSQNKLWNAFIGRSFDARSIQVSNKRIKLLNEDKFTASVVTEILTVVGEISEETRSRLNSSRSARNKWAHATEERNAEQARSSILVAHDMFRRVLPRGGDLPQIALMHGLRS